MIGTNRIHPPAPVADTNMSSLTDKSKQRGATNRPSRSRWKGLLFRLAAVLLGLLPLVAAEVVLRAFDVGRPTDFDDPFVGFSDIHPLFVLNKEQGRYEIAKSRLSHFRPDSFRAEKAENEFRIFVLGGSTVQGRPWSIETSFTTWLELGLNSAHPSRQWEVINCGGISYATYRLVPIMQEVLAYQPDLIIFCEGHNEFLEDRTYGNIKTVPPALSWPQRQVTRLRTYTLLREGILRLTGQAGESSKAPAKSESKNRPVLGPETDAMLDWKGGMANYHRDPDWQADVLAHFAFNLGRMADITREADVPLLIVSPVSNLEWPPFKPQHRSDITAAEQKQFDDLLKIASEEYRDGSAQALEPLLRARAIDDQHALVHYQIGICQKELLRFAEAEKSLILAKDLDVCPLRMLERFKRALHASAAETKTPLLDAHALIAEHSRSGFPDNQWLVDHVHPTVEGHQLIADAIVTKMAELRHVRPQPNWEQAKELAYRDFLKSLDHAYFQRGQTFLDAEQRWAHGFADKERPVLRRPANHDQAPFTSPDTD